MSSIDVSNEVFTADEEHLRNSLVRVVPTARNLHAALAQLGMDVYVRVSTDSSLAVPAGGHNEEVDLAAPGSVAHTRSHGRWHPCLSDEDDQPRTHARLIRAARV